MSEQRQTRAVINAEDRGSAELWIRSHLRSVGEKDWFSTKKGGRGGSLKKKKEQTNWIFDVWCRKKKKKVFASQTMMSSNVASASWLPQEKKGGKKPNVASSACSIYCSSEPKPGRKCVSQWIYVLCGCPHFLMSPADNMSIARKSCKRQAGTCNRSNWKPFQ